MTLLYTMQDEYNNQIAKEGAGGGVSYGKASIASLSSSIQPQKIHTASIVRLPDTQNIYEIGLSRHYRPSQ